MELEHDEIASHEHVIAVGNSTTWATRARSCAYGPRLAFIAPGSHVFNLRGPYGDYGTSWGSSYAAPIGAGIAALMLSRNSNLSALEIRSLMEQNCAKVSAMADGVSRDNLHGHGVIDAKACVDAAAAAPGGGL